jgi:hypothetical protein
MVVLNAGCGKKSATGSTSTSQKNTQSVITEEKKDNGSVNLDVNNTTDKSKSSQGEAEDKTKTTIAASERKIIKNADIQLETLQFDKTNSSILSKTEQFSGYVESSNITGTSISDKDTISNRTARFVLRIPKNSFDKFLNDLGSIGNITSKTVSGNDVTSQYFDTEAHLKSLQVEEDRLLEILKKTGELKDIIEVEKELTNVRYQIENLTGTLKKWDNLVDYCTINLVVSEVQKINIAAAKPVTLGEKISYTFKLSIKSLSCLGKGAIIAITAVIPYLIIIIPILFLVRYVLKKKEKK